MTKDMNKITDKNGVIDHGMCPPCTCECDECRAWYHEAIKND